MNFFGEIFNSSMYIYGEENVNQFDETIREIHNSITEIRIEDGKITKAILKGKIQEEKKIKEIKL